MISKTIRSNRTNLNVAEEVEPGVLPSEATAPSANVWLKMEPNSYSDFGATVDLVAREPISDDRQREKGEVVGLDAGGGFEHDFTASPELQTLLKGFMFANFREKATITATAVTADGYTVASGGAAFRQGDLVFVSGSAIAGNNGLKVVGAGSDADTVAVTGLSVEAGANITITVVGFAFTATDASVDAAVGELPMFNTTTKDLTQLGLVPGEIVFLGGDGANERFASASNSGFCRVKSVAANTIVFDKTDQAMVDDAGTGRTIRMFFGRVLKNEVGTGIVPRTYRIERALGAPDLAEPTQVQAEYLKGAVPNTLGFNMPARNKLTLDLNFIAQDYETRAHDEGLLPGSRNVLPKRPAFNSSSDVKRKRLAVYPSGALSSAPEPLFALVREFNFSINNNAAADTALGYIGAVEITEGMFEVSGSMTAFFATVSALKAIRDSADVTFDFAMWKNNRGFAVDFPLLTLGDGRLGVANNAKVTIPLDLQPSRGDLYDAAMNHTVLMVFFDYLPSFASRRVD